MITYILEEEKGFILNMNTKCSKDKNIYCLSGLEIQLFLQTTGFLTLFLEAF